MSVQSNSPTTPRDVRELLSQVEQQGTPLRIDSATGTYYVLSADQLMALISAIAEDGEYGSSFTPEDFGLTEADIAAYEARRKARRERIDVDALSPLDTDLEQRLRNLNQIRREQMLSTDEEQQREQLLHELEAAMTRNLQAVANATG